ncbi:hypothetical protein ACQBAR_07250 [Propionibacteriaceae bacterium Y1685]
MISRGELPAVKVGPVGPRARIRIKLSDVEACTRPIPTVGSAAGK